VRAGLTRRQRRIVRLVVHGETRRQIAQRLHLSEATVSRALAAARRRLRRALLD
jgi:DNA-binding NarL/FixJ family response regulator